MIPQRMCAVCREVKPRSELIRIAKTSCGFEIDKTNKLQGRGAYICNDNACIALARKKRVFERSFSCKIESAFYDMVEAMVNEGE